MELKVYLALNQIYKTIDMLKRFNTNDYLIRIPLFIIFFWFGILKVLDVSPATKLIVDTVYWMPFLSAETWSIVIGYWEMAIGVCFLNKKTTFASVILMFAVGKVPAEIILL